MLFERAGNDSRRKLSRRKEEKRILNRKPERKIGGAKRLGTSRERRKPLQIKLELAKKLRQNRTREKRNISLRKRPLGSINKTQRAPLKKLLKAKSGEKARSRIRLVKIGLNVLPMGQSRPKQDRLQLTKSKTAKSKRFLEKGFSRGMKSKTKRSEKSISRMVRDFKGKAEQLVTPVSIKTKGQPLKTSLKKKLRESSKKKTQRSKGGFKLKENKPNWNFKFNKKKRKLGADKIEKVIKAFAERSKKLDRKLSIKETDKRKPKNRSIDIRRPKEVKDETPRPKQLRTRPESEFESNNSPRTKAMAFNRSGSSQNSRKFIVPGNKKINYSTNSRTGKSDPPSLSPTQEKTRPEMSIKDRSTSQKSGISISTTKKIKPESRESTISEYMLRQAVPREKASLESFKFSRQSSRVQFNLQKTFKETGLLIEGMSSVVNTNRNSQKVGNTQRSGKSTMGLWSSSIKREEKWESAFMTKASKLKKSGKKEMTEEPKEIRKFLSPERIKSYLLREKPEKEFGGEPSQNFFMKYKRISSKSNLDSRLDKSRSRNQGDKTPPGSKHKRSFFKREESKKMCFKDSKKEIHNQNNVKSLLKLKPNGRTSRENYQSIDNKTTCSINKDMQSKFNFQLERIEEVGEQIPRVLDLIERLFGVQNFHNILVKLYKIEEFINVLIGTFYILTHQVMLIKDKSSHL